MEALKPVMGERLGHDVCELVLCANVGDSYMVVSLYVPDLMVLGIDMLFLMMEH